MGRGRPYLFSARSAAVLGSSNVSTPTTLARAQTCCARGRAHSAKPIPPVGEKVPGLPASYLFTVLPAPVAQTCSLSVSPRIVASRANFTDRGCVRSTSRSTPIFPGATRCGWVFDHSRGPFWLRLRRAVLYRRVALCQTSGNHNAWGRSDALPITNRRYGRLKICATVNRYPASCRQRNPRTPLPTRRRQHPGEVRASSRRLLQYEITTRDEGWGEQSIPATGSVHVLYAIRQ